MNLSGVIVVGILVGVLTAQADPGLLLTEDGNPIVTESGDRILVENGKSLDMNAFAKSKSGRLNIEKGGKRATIILADQKRIILKKKTATTWTPIDLVAQSKLFDVWEIELRISDSLPNAEISIQGCGYNPSTDSKGQFKGSFYVDSIPKERTVSLRSEKEISDHLQLNGNTKAKCVGSKKLKCTQIRR